jgi:hypothetical protein
MAAALEPAIRAAAAQAGKPIHYAQADFIADLPPAEARALLGRMDDAEIAAALAPRSRLARRAATASWWPELARAARGWPRPPSYMADSVEPDCPVLGLAVAGAGDTSPGAGDSWAVVDAWLAAGLTFAGCPREVADARPFDVARRAAAQRQDWRVRTTPRP